MPAWPRARRLQGVAWKRPRYRARGPTASLDGVSTRGQRQIMGRDEETGSSGRTKKQATSSSRFFVRPQCRFFVPTWHRPGRRARVPRTRSSHTGAASLICELRVLRGTRSHRVASAPLIPIVRTRSVPQVFANDRNRDTGRGQGWPSRRRRRVVQTPPGHALTAASTASSWLQSGFAKFRKPRAVLPDLRAATLI
jgi:hypothetical protein